MVVNVVKPSIAFLKFIKNLIRDLPFRKFYTQELNQFIAKKRRTDVKLKSGVTDAAPTQKNKFHDSHD